MTARSTWIAAYQKSGTTWTRFLVCRLLTGSFDTSATVDAMVPNIHGNASWEGHLQRGGGVLATHKRYDKLVERYGRCVSGFVHVVRHPADVLLSEARFYCLSHAGTVQRREGSVSQERLEQMFREYLTVILARGVGVRHERLGMGSWASHARSWLDGRAEHPHVLLRYEDLKSDPVHELRRVATFFGQDPTDDDLRSVVEDCSAERMRAMQEREVALRQVGSLYYGSDWEPAYDLGLRFVGRAAVGDGLQLGSRALAQIDRLFGPVMARLGYAVDPAAPVCPMPTLHTVVPLLTPA